MDKKNLPSERLIKLGRPSQRYEGTPDLKHCPGLLAYTAPRTRNLAELGIAWHR